MLLVLRISFLEWRRTQWWLSILGSSARQAGRQCVALSACCQDPMRACWNVLAWLCVCVIYIGWTKEMMWDQNYSAKHCCLPGLEPSHMYEWMNEYIIYIMTYKQQAAFCLINCSNATHNGNCGCRCNGIYEPWWATDHRSFHPLFHACTQTAQFTYQTTTRKPSQRENNVGRDHDVNYWKTNHKNGSITVTDDPNLKLWS